MVLHLLLLLASLAQTSEADLQASELELKLADLESSYIVSEVLKSRPPEDENLKCPLTKLHQDIEKEEQESFQAKSQQVVANDFLVKGIFVNRVLVQIVLEQITVEKIYNLIQF